MDSRLDPTIFIGKISVLFLSLETERAMMNVTIISKAYLLKPLANVMHRIKPIIRYGFLLGGGES